MKKNIIKNLAKKSLERKWYPLKKYEKGFLSDDCAFCYYYDKCRDCILNDSNLCGNITRLGIDGIIKALKKIKRTGKIKKTYDRF